MLKPVIVGLGWFAGSPDDRIKLLNSYLVNNFGLCGCGKSARYLVPNSKEGSCNKYARCSPISEDREMKSLILLELAKRWEEDAVEPQCQDASPSAQEFNAIAKGERQAKRECADTLRMLVSILGEKPKREDDGQLDKPLLRPRS